MCKYELTVKRGTTAPTIKLLCVQVGLQVVESRREPQEKHGCAIKPHPEAKTKVAII